MQTPYACCLCSWQWFGRSDAKPARCPHCHSARWETGIDGRVERARQAQRERYEASLDDEW